MDYDYNFKDLLSAYAELGVEPGGLVYVASDLGQLMRYREPGREALLDAHLRALRQRLGSAGTIFVPTASLNLCNSGIAFDVHRTPSVDMGIFSEYVRTRNNAVRSFHPFWSVAGIGPAAAEMLGAVARHAYGWGSVFQRFVACDVLAVNIGRAPRFAIPVIHHIETVVGVPYRYTKEFIHPVWRGGSVTEEPFYLSVLYPECDIARDGNRKIMDHFADGGGLRETKIGRGKAWSFSHRRFFEMTTRLFEGNIYSWLEHVPTRRPYRR